MSHLLGDVALGLANFFFVNLHLNAHEPMSNSSGVIITALIRKQNFHVDHENTTQLTKSREEREIQIRYKGIFQKTALAVGL